MNRSDFEYLLKVLKENAGWNFSEEDFFILDKKITNFIREKGYATIEELMDEVRIGQRTFINQFVESLTLLGTNFYRDYSVFKQFEDAILPYLREYNRGVKKLRIWSAGCSTGQETFSIAISIKNKLLNVNDWDIEIIGTDINQTAIQKAQSSIYNQFEIQTGMNAQAIINNFHHEKDNWVVNDDIMEMVSFKRHNLLDDFSLSEKFDVIFCRNVLKLFTPELQKQILNRIYEVQTPGGLLYVGKNERIDGIEDFYTKVPGFDSLFQTRNLNIQNRVNLPQRENKAANSNDTEWMERSAMPSFIRPEKLIERPKISDLFKK